ncbi:MAG: TraB/GumN family protein [Thermomonas sp.]
MLIVGICLALCFPAHPQQAPLQPVNSSAAPAIAAGVGADGIRTEEAVVVTGDQPGPGLWLVRKGGHDLWILGTLSPLPAKMQWRATQVEVVIANAQEVLYPPSLTIGSDINKFRALLLLPSLVGVRNNPDGKKLKDVLPANTYVRWEAYRDRFLPGDRDVDKMRPVFAAQQLWKAAIKRSGLDGKDPVKPIVSAAIERHHPSVTVVKQTINIKDPKAAIKQFKSSQFEDIACMERTLDRLGEDMQAMRNRANAWAMGDIPALRAVSLSDQYQVCMEAVTESGMGRKLGMGDVSQRLETEWVAKAETALLHNATTFATLPMRDMLKPGGYADQLRAKGYAVLAPDDD